MPDGRHSSRRRFLAAGSLGATAAAFGASPSIASAHDSGQGWLVVGTRAGDYATLQHAVAAAPATGASILVRAGVHVIERTVLLRSRLIVAGEGDGTVLQAAPNIHAAVLATPAGTSDITIRDLKIDARKDRQSVNVNCVSVYGGQRIKVINVRAVNANGYGITTFPPDSNDVQFLDCVAEDCRDESFEMRGVRGGQIRGCVSRRAGKNGVYLWAGTAQGSTLVDVVVADNLINGSGAAFAGICVDEKAAAVVVAGNAVADCAGQGILVFGDSTDVTVEGNIVRRCGRAGIHVELARQVSITANTVLGGASDGIRVAYARDVTVSANAVRRNAASGIDVITANTSK